jgi:prepilin-type N-terminal cleavage/methylation domain-containing protein
MNDKKSGFTLVELSIVLVIIGLIVGGIVGGQSLIQSAKLNTVIQDLSSVQTAVRTYQMQYEYYPGDHPNAYDYFDGSGGSSICGNPTGVSLADCNGNGNGVINNTSGNFEDQNSFLHMNLAGIIQGNFSGAYNQPTSFWPLELKGAYLDVTGGRSGSSRVNGWYGAYIKISTDLHPDFYADCALSSLDALMIDKKIDDGKAGTGSVLGREANNGASCPNSCLDDEEYDKTQSKESCVVYVRL